MGRMKTVEILLSAVSMVITAAKSIINFIKCMGKLKTQST